MPLPCEQINTDYLCSVGDMDTSEEAGQANDRADGFQLQDTEGA